jgi:hypothetical protein
VLSLFSGGLEAKRKNRAPLAGKSTVNRLEHALGGGEDRYRKISHDAVALETVFVDVFLDAHAKLRLWFSSFACVLIRALQRIGLPHTELAQATCGTIRLKVLKPGARRRQVASTEASTPESAPNSNRGATKGLPRARRQRFVVDSWIYQYCQKRRFGQGPKREDGYAALPVSVDLQ